MTVAIQKMTLEEFLAYDDGTDKLYELENGELIDMPSESDINQRIGSFLFAFFLGLGISSYRLRISRRSCQPQPRKARLSVQAE